MKKNRCSRHMQMSFRVYGLRFMGFMVSGMVAGCATATATT